MKVRALIVDDDVQIVRAVEHVVQSLPQPHECQSAGDVATARKMLQTKKIDYLVLDMNLPLDARRATGRRESGRNLLEWLRGDARFKDLPVVVITGEDRGESDFILSVMRVGGMAMTRYVQKPIDGDKLEKEIRGLLAPSVVRADQAPMELAPFDSGVLVYQGECVFLKADGRMPIKILSGKGIGHARKMLEILREQHSGRFVRRSGEKLAVSIGAVGIGAVTGAAATIRKKVRSSLKKHLNLTCGDQDVLVNDDQGYHLNDAKISIETIAPDAASAGNFGARHPRQKRDS